jgi:tRNA (mo5U34)-methyltransferase
MPARSLKWGDFRLTIAIPERLGRLIRRAVPRRSRGQGHQELVIQQPPSVRIEPRDPERALAFMPPEARSSSNSHPHDIADHTWYHTIELPNGDVTPGEYDHRRLVPFYGLPDDLHGKRVLDVGSADGFWAFEFERRGAHVTALDIGKWNELDLPPSARDLAISRGLSGSVRNGFEIARRELGSEVEPLTASIYEVDPNQVGTFDLVHSGDLLLHLRDPVRALQQMRKLTSSQALISNPFSPELDIPGAGQGLTRYLGGWETVTWWLPALSTLTQMVADAGFADVEIVTTYRLAWRGAEGRYSWAVLRARV